MKFNLNDYTSDKYVMHCKTEEEANDFCKFLDSIGRKWQNGASYTTKTYWDSHRENTCYSFNKGLYATIEFYRDAACIILEWSNFMNKQFTRDYLRTGDFIVHANGTVGMVVREFDVIVTRGGVGTTLSHYTQDLLCTLSCKGLNIIKVYRPTGRVSCNFGTYWQGTLVYDRDRDTAPPVTEMTMEEICKALGKSVKVIRS